MIISIKQNWASIEVKHNNFVLKKIDDYLARTQHQGPKSLTAHFVEKTKLLIISNNFRDLALAARYYDFVIRKNSNNKDLIKVFKKILLKYSIIIILLLKRKDTTPMICVVRQKQEAVLIAINHMHSP